MVDYSFYSQDYLGNTIPEGEFLPYANHAFDRVSAYTMGRAEEDEESVWQAVCAIADMLYETEGRLGTSHETVDGYSVSYVDVSRQMYDAATTYIPASLFYRGAERGVY